MSIEIRNVAKRYKDVLALDSVSTTIGENRIYGLLGNNGAGKTTLLSIISNRIYADSGEVLVDGEPSADNDRALGKMFLMGEQNYYPDDMRVKKALETTALFYPEFSASYANSLAMRFGLNMKQKITSLSTGYASIFRLIVAMSVNTPYVFFDEPVLGLDAQHRDMFYKLLIEKYSEHPCTVVISTHLIQEVSAIIDHSIIIKDGKIIRDASKDELLSDVFCVSGPAALVDSFANGRSVVSSSVLGGLKTVCLSGKCSGTEIPAGLEVGAVNLQDYFINLMNAEGKI